MLRRTTPQQRVTHWKGLVLMRVTASQTSVTLLPPDYQYHQISGFRWLVAPDGSEYVLADGWHYWISPEPTTPP